MPLRDDLLNPISPEAPGGVELRYEPVYEEVKEARREDDPNLPRHEHEGPPKQADWSLVEKLCSEALVKESKDLQLAVWLAEALLRREGFGGFRQGLDYLTALLQQFWDHLYPEIDEGDLEYRAAPLMWIGSEPSTRGGMTPSLAVRMVALNGSGHSFLQYKEAQSVPTEEAAEESQSNRDRRTSAIEEGDLPPEEWETAFKATPKEWYRTLVGDIDGVLASLVALDEVGDGLFGEAAPSYRVLRTSLEDVRISARQMFARKLELEPDPGGGMDEALAGEGGLVSVGGSSSATQASSGPPKSRKEAGERVAVAARYFRESDPTDPGPYLMLRGLRWGELRAGGGLDPRLLEAPPTAVRTRLKTLLLDGDWVGLLEGGEEVMATPFGRGWLDLQRYILTASDGLGAEYGPIGSAIRGALRALLRDLPELSEATLMDDTAAANRETRTWLRDQGLFGDFSDEAEAEMPAAGSSAPARSAGGGGAQPRAVALARQMARAGNPEKGIEMLMRGVDSEQSQRAKFLLRSAAAEVMVGAGLESVAFPMLRDLVQLVDGHRLDEWEDGETIARPFALLCRCLDRTGEDPQARQEFYLRVCTLDPMMAIELQQSESHRGAGGDDENSYGGDG